MHKQNSKYSRPPVLLFWMAIIFIIGVIGPTAASWMDLPLVNTVVSTGDIDPVFSKADVIPQENADGEQLSGMDCNVSTSIENDGKRLVIRIDGAYPDYSTKIQYEICNRGSVPVRFTTRLEADDLLEVTNSLEEGLLEGNNDRVEGELSIDVGEVEEESSYDFEIVLDFEQWNHS